MPLPKEELYTTDFIYNLPDGERAELIDGQIYYMAPPTFTHQKLGEYTVYNSNGFLNALDTHNVELSEVGR